MKLYNRFLISIILFFIVSVQSSTAETIFFSKADITYSLDTSTGEITASYVKSESDTYYIESYLDYKSIRYYVTTIGEKLFYNNSSVKKVILPKTIKKIESKAFYHCYNLEITDVAGHVDPISCTYIGDHAFDSCKRLTTLPKLKSLEYIGDYAFLGCTNLTFNILDYSGIKYVGSYAFSDCKKLETLPISNSTTHIGNSAFSGCSLINSTLIIPKNIETMGKGAFSGCSAMRGDIEIPENFTSIPAALFENCSSLTSVTFPSTITEIESYAFYGCSGLTGELKLPYYSLKTIWNSAFTGCTGLTGNLIIPRSLETIGAYAFSGCTGFTGSLIIPDSVKEIGGGAFQNCKGFSRLYLNNSISSIPIKAFEGCTGFIGSLIIPESVIDIGHYAFNGCSGFLSLTLGNNLQTIAEFAFLDCCNLKGNLEIPESVYYIGPSAFKNCSGFTGDLTLPKLVQVVEHHSFDGCTGFNGTLNLPEGLIEIGSSAFEGCSHLQGKLIIPDSVQSVNSSAFANCSGFTSLQLGSGLLTLGNTSSTSAVFSGCSSLTSVTSLAVNPPATNYSSNFDAKVYSMPLYVPSKSIPLYKTARDWENFTIIGGCEEPAENIVFEDETMGRIENLTIQVGNSYKLTVKPIPSNAALPALSWFSDNEGVVYVSPDGELEALSIGDAVVRASGLANGIEISTSCNITVVSAPLVNLKLSQNEAQVEEGKSIQLHVIYEPGEANPNLKWCVDNDDIISLESINNEEYNVIGMKSGKATITVTSDDTIGLSDSCVVTVVEDISGIDDIYADINSTFELFNTSGILIKSNATKADLQTFSPGIYIILSKGQAFKVKI